MIILRWAGGWVRGCVRGALQAASLPPRRVVALLPVLERSPLGKCARSINFEVMSLSRFCQPGVLVVEGNISAGKTTITKLFAQHPNTRVFLEPANENPFLDKFYKDPKTWALPLQLWILRLRFVTYAHAVEYAARTGGVAVLDRSIFSDWVFAEQNRIDGNISEQGFAYYMELRQHMLRSLPAPELLLYLDVTPEECHRRVHYMRQRECESVIPVEYLRGLDVQYKNLVHQMQTSGCASVSVQWSNFGDADVLVRETLASLRPRATEIPGFVQEIMESAEQFRAAMTINHPARAMFDMEESMPTTDHLIDFMTQLSTMSGECAQQWVSKADCAVESPTTKRVKNVMATEHPTGSKRVAVGPPE